MKHGRHLEPRDRATLAAIIADRPHLSHRQVARLLAARTGAEVTGQAVARARSRGDRPEGTRAHLPAPARAARDQFLMEMAGRMPWAEVARQFEAATGRPVDPRGLARRARAMGLVAGRRVAR